MFAFESAGLVLSFLLTRWHFGLFPSFLHKADLGFGEVG
jgi:hypothetical protein